MTTKGTKIVNFILGELSVNKDKSIIMTSTVKNWAMGDRQFNRYWQVANKMHMEKQTELLNVLNQMTVDDAIAKKQTVLMNRKSMIDELFEDFKDLKKMKAGNKIDVMDKDGKIIEVVIASPFDEVRAKQTRLSIVEKIAQLEGWGPIVETPAQSVINNNVQQNNITQNITRRTISFKTRVTTLKDQEIVEDAEE